MGRQVNLRMAKRRQQKRRQALSEEISRRFKEMHDEIFGPDEPPTPILRLVKGDDRTDD